MQRGITLMLPSEDAIFVGEELQQRFGLPYWQFALTATDANRFSIRLARQSPAAQDSGFQLVLSRHGGRKLYHSAATASQAAAREHWPAGRSVGYDQGCRVQRSWPRLSMRLNPGDVACVLAEPVMTNVGIVHPEPGYHAACAN